MTANELRLGNIIQFNNRVIPAYNVVITARFFASLAGGRAQQELDTTDEEISAYYSGIPLTPEILQLCGFIKDRTGFSLLDKMSLSFSVTKHSKFLPCWMDRTLYPGAWRTVEYVHQLQNLYYALTGEELNINL